jgi:hypothetical protein
MRTRSRFDVDGGDSAAALKPKPRAPNSTQKKTPRPGAGSGVFLCVSVLQNGLDDGSDFDGALMLNQMKADDLKDYSLAIFHNPKLHSGCQYMHVSNSD